MPPDYGYPSYSRHRFNPLNFLSGWQPLGAPYSDPATWQDGFGLWHLRGVAQQPAGPFALPNDIGSVANPADGRIHRFAVAASGQLGIVEVVPGAGAAFLRYTAGPNAAGTTLSLEQIIYPG